MKVVFVTDPLEALDPSTDTSVGLMHAAQDRDAEVWVTEAHLLEAVNGRARALSRRLRLAPSRPDVGHRWTVADTWFTAREPQYVWLDDAAAVFMRTEPPLDRTYLTEHGVVVVDVDAKAKDLTERGTPYTLDQGVLRPDPASTLQVPFEFSTA